MSSINIARSTDCFPFRQSSSRAMPVRAENFSTNASGSHSLPSSRKAGCSRLGLFPSRSLPFTQSRKSFPPTMPCPLPSSRGFSSSPSNPETINFRYPCLPFRLSPPVWERTNCQDERLGLDSPQPRLFDPTYILCYAQPDGFGVGWSDSSSGRSAVQPNSAFGHTVAPRCKSLNLSRR